MNPKVFLSHASEDKERFVIEFAKQLRSKGVDIWLDKWEMFVGDSLVDKIFEEGLKEAEAIIIVISENSINKPWVKEELNAAIVRRISNGTKILPVIIDDCEVPMSLVSTIWEKISNLESYDNSVRTIVNSIFGLNDKPALGDVPQHVSSKYFEIAELTKSDNIVLKGLCEHVLKSDSEHLDPEVVFGDGSYIGLSEDEIKECIDILEDMYFIKVSRFSSGNFQYSYHCLIRITAFGFHEYACAYLSNYDDTINKTVSMIVNENIHSAQIVHEKLDVNLYIVNSIFQLLEDNGHVVLSSMVSPFENINKVEVSLKRSLR
ncbi:MAG: toll/interleukin-1 receptor domain-containing protein [Fibrobacterales bacterium]